MVQAFRLALNSAILFVFENRRVGLCITLLNHDLFILHDILAVSGLLQLLKVVLKIPQQMIASLIIYWLV